MSEIELKPCPFCGSGGVIYFWQDEDLWSHNIVEWQKVRCTGCECEGQSSCEGYEESETAVAVWNTRAPQWQPIESAPKDGTRILLFGDGDQVVAYFNVGYGTWGDGDHHDDIQGLTHWQPLPAAPEVEG